MTVGRNKLDVIGNGFIAQKLKEINFKNVNNFVVYAAGISNSKTRNLSKLKKEIHKIENFLESLSKDKIIIYISTLSALEKKPVKSLYVKNKKKIEDLIKKNLNNFIIVRFPQVVGKNSNPNTLTNYLYEKIKNKKKFFINFNTKRNLIDILDVKKVVKEILKNKKFKRKIINIRSNESLYIEQIVNILSKIIKKKPRLKILKLKSNYKNNFIYKKPKDNQFKKIFDKSNYTESVLKRYYK